MLNRLKRAAAVSLSLLMAGPAIVGGTAFAAGMPHGNPAGGAENSLLAQVNGPPGHAGRGHKAHGRGGPPPWAPAHGYRRKHRDYFHRHYGYAGPPPIDFTDGHCNRESVGRILGGAAGAAVGSQIGDGSGRLVAIATGAIFGTMIGGSIGRDLDEADRACMGTAFEHASPGERVVWDGPRQNDRYAVTPQDVYQTSSGRYCREYQAESWVNGEPVQTYGTACRQPDGSWQIVNRH